MVFMGVILQMTPGACKAHEIRHRITRRLYLWEIGKYAALCSDTVVERRFQPTQTTRENEETDSRTFNLKVVNVKIWVAVRGIQGQEHTGVLFPGDVDTKTRGPVMEALREKHPAIQIPDLTDPE